VLQWCNRTWDNKVSNGGRQMRIEEESDNVGDIVAEAEVNLGFEKPCITEEELDEQEAEEAQNKCKFCNRVIGDYVSNYHIGCYRQMKKLEESK